MVNIKMKDIFLILTVLLWLYRTMSMFVGNTKVLRGNGTTG